MQFHISFEVVYCSSSTGKTFIFPVDLKSLKVLLLYINSITTSSGKSLGNNPFQPIPSYSCMKDESGRAMKER